MRLYLLAAIAGFFVTSALHAEPITYTLTSIFSGTLGANSFSGVAGTFTFTGDTSTIVDQGAGFFANTAGSSTFSLTGFGTATFLSPTFGAASSPYDAGFFDPVTNFGFNDYNPLNPSFASYGLTGPFSDTGFLLGTFGGTESTSLGDLTITGDFASDATFRAEVSQTPEPSSLILLGTGLTGLFGMARRRVLSRNRASQI